VILTNNIHFFRFYAALLLVNSIVSGCYPADLMVEPGVRGCYPLKVLDNTPGPGIIQHLSSALLIEGMIFSEQGRTAPLLRKNHPWILQPPIFFHVRTPKTSVV
jgi:hypothetical protein